MKKVLKEVLNIACNLLYLYGLSYLISLTFDISFLVALFPAGFLILCIYLVILYFAIVEMNSELNRYKQRDKKRRERDQAEYNELSRRIQKNCEEINEYLTESLKRYEDKENSPVEIMSREFEKIKKEHGSLFVKGGNE